MSFGACRRAVFQVGDGCLHFMCCDLSGMSSHVPFGGEQVGGQWVSGPVARCWEECRSQGFALSFEICMPFQRRDGLVVGIMVADSLPN